MSKVPVDKQSTALNGVKNIIENRVNLFGISEPNVQTSVFEGKKRIILKCHIKITLRQGVTLEFYAYKNILN